MTPDEFFKEYELSVDKPTKTSRELSPAEIFEAIEGHPYRHHLVEFIQNRKEIAKRMATYLAKSTPIEADTADALLFELLVMMCFHGTAKAELAKYQLRWVVETLPSHDALVFFTTLRRETIRDARRAEDHETWQFASYTEDCITEIIKMVNEL